MMYSEEGEIWVQLPSQVQITARWLELQAWPLHLTDVVPIPSPMLLVLRFFLATWDPALCQPTPQFWLHIGKREMRRGQKESLRLRTIT